MRRKMIWIAAVALLLVGLAATTALIGKGHIPAHKAQFCHAGQAIEVGIAASRAHLAHGDSPLPANDPECIYFKGNSCDNANPCPHQP